MARLEWTDDLDTGIDVIDGQHRRIVEFINNLQEARLAGNQAVIGEVIEGMVDYTLSSVPHRVNEENASGCGLNSSRRASPAAAVQASALERNSASAMRAFVAAGVPGFCSIIFLSSTRALPGSPSGPISRSTSRFVA